MSISIISSRYAHTHTHTYTHTHTHTHTHTYIYIYIYIYIAQPLLYIFTNPSVRAGYDTKSIFKRSLTGLNSEFSFSLTSCLAKAEEPSLPYYLSIIGGRIIGFIPFPRVLVPCELQSVSSRIWTRVAVFISYDDNLYTTGTSYMCVCVSVCVSIGSKYEWFVFFVLWHLNHRGLFNAEAILQEEQL